MSNHNTLISTTAKPGTKILVIEDDELIRANIIDILEAQRFKVIAAKNGRLGISLAQEILPDLILCDVMMPELDGYAVLAGLRQDPLTAVIPFIFLTALADRANTRKGMELGADDYLIKPCKPQELLNAIATRLAKQTIITGVYTTALKQASQQLNKSRKYDSLTELPNRLLLEERFNQIITWNLSHKKQLPAGSKQLISILYLSLDRFEKIVEFLGHSSCDLLLKAVAERLHKCVEESNTIARLNTDEFVIIIATPQTKKGISKIAQTIIDELCKPFLIENNSKLIITVSIGIAFYMCDGDDLEKLLLSSYKAMLKSKENGGNLYTFYRSSFQIITSENLALQTSLGYALEREELEVYYQPKVSLRTGKIVGAEALLRWNHSQLGIISPARFIPIAEETNLIVPIGEWVLKTACQQTKGWHNAGFSDLRIAVNISARQFNQPDLYSRVYQLLIETGLDPKYLELELTESVLMQNTEVSIVRLTAFKALGVQIAIDDFGTGYSSLSYLQQFPFETLKIDKSFIGKVNSDPKTKLITKNIIQMAHDLKLNLVAEGVETQAELNFLYYNDCDEMQGYLFDKPLNVRDFEERLLAGKSLQILPAKSDLD
ncbi:EAL domain-containing protein [Planktothrix sp. FACHB-1355]|uniref:EAL domain-containing protein n=1 Tax=Aerosakkonema funiforme FACHB-1375 TaxID=2949571 RepID=A0A926VKW3_9CYAN|nr:MULTISPECIES: EAL domain-containing response regulator [Oscillatoriales]MBD2185756.1 EAL domain-containing protein [Aerosakkonema funiforme FACHB-1375]MBD3558330.1 EAL domain-containing protein [Planktothrix sp. FACHB-1355]